MHSLRRPKEGKGKEEKKPTLEDIHQSILIVLSDDPHLRKKAVKPLQELLSQLTNQPIDDSQITTSIPTDFHKFLQDDEKYAPLLDFESKSENDNRNSREKSMTSAAKEILQTLQQHATRKLLSPDLITIASFFSHKHQIPLAKKFKKSKPRILEWMALNWATFEISLEEAIIHCNSKHEL